MGRGEWFKSNNSFFRAQVNEHYATYAQNRKPQEKRKVASMVIANVHATGGRFLDVDGTILSEDKTMIKVMKALKDKKRKFAAPADGADPKPKPSISSKAATARAKARLSSKVSLKASTVEAKVSDPAPPTEVRVPGPALFDEGKTGMKVPPYAVSRNPFPRSVSTSSYEHFEEDDGVTSLEEPPHQPSVMATFRNSIPPTSSMPVSPEASRPESPIEWNDTTGDDHLAPFSFEIESKPSTTGGIYVIPQSAAYNYKMLDHPSPFQMFRARNAGIQAIPPISLMSAMRPIFAPSARRFPVYSHSFAGVRGVEPIASAAPLSDPIWEETLQHLQWLEDDV